MNKDAKTLLENFISLSSLQLIGMLLPLITLPYIFRVIGFEKYGIIVFAAALIAYFQSLTDYSFKITAVRDVAVFKGSQKKLNIIYSKVLIVKGLSLLFSLILLTLIVSLYTPFYENRMIYWLSMLILLGYALFPEWFFQGIEKMRYITYLNLGIKLFFTLCVFVFIKTEADFWIYPLLQSLGYIVAGLIGQYIMVRKYKLRFIFLPVKSIVETVRKNFPIFVNQFVPNLYNNTSIFLLGLLTNNTLVGIYNAILIIVNLIVTLLEIISRVFFPFLNRNKGKFSMYAQLATAVAVVLVVGVIISHQLVFWYLNISYDQAFLVLAILSFGILGYSLYNVFGINYFIIHRQDRIVMWNTLCSSIIGLVLAYPLINYFGVVGAAINLTLCRWLMGGGLVFKYFRLKRAI